MPRQSPPLDLTGQTFVFLRVLGADPQRSKDNRRLWLCQCECGRVVSLSTGSLRSAGYKSCGCKKVTKDRNDKIRKGMLRVWEERKQKNA